MATQEGKEDYPPLPSSLEPVPLVHVDVKLDGPEQGLGFGMWTQGGKDESPVLLSLELPNPVHNKF